MRESNCVVDVGMSMAASSSYCVVSGGFLASTSKLKSHGCCLFVCIGRRHDSANESCVVVAIGCTLGNIRCTTDVNEDGNM